MSDSSPTNPFAESHGAIAIILIRHAMLPVMWFFVTVFIMPVFGDLVSDFGNDQMNMPPITQAVMNISQFTINHPILIAFSLVLLLAADAAIYIMFLKTQSTATAKAWAVIIILAQAVATALYTTAMLLPMVIPTITIFG